MDDRLLLKPRGHSEQLLFILKILFTFFYKHKLPWCLMRR